MKKNSNKSNKLLLEICEQLDAQPDISQEEESSSSSESETEKSIAEEKVSNLLESLLPDKKYDEFSTFLISKEKLTRNDGACVENVVHDFEKSECAFLDTGAQKSVIGVKQALAC